MPDRAGGAVDIPSETVFYFSNFSSGYRIYFLNL